jgi:hypothetical protein
MSLCGDIDVEAHRRSCRRSRPRVGPYRLTRTTRKYGSYASWQNQVAVAIACVNHLNDSHMERSLGNAQGRQVMGSVTGRHRVMHDAC